MNVLTHTPGKSELYWETQWWLTSGLSESSCSSHVIKNVSYFPLATLVPFLLASLPSFSSEFFSTQQRWPSALQVCTLSAQTINGNMCFLQPLNNVSNSFRSVVQWTWSNPGSDPSDSNGWGLCVPGEEWGQSHQNFMVPRKVRRGREKLVVLPKRRKRKCHKQRVNQ